MEAKTATAIISIMSLVFILLYLGSIYTVPLSSKASQSISETIISQNTSKFLEIGEIYKELGYPKTSWNPEKPNYTVSYRSYWGSPVYYDIGYLKLNAIGLKEALKIASKTANIAPDEYKLVSAYFSPGHVVNGSLMIEPTWSLHFVRVFKGYWIWGGLGDYSDVEVTVDASRSEVKQISRYEEDLPPSNISFSLKISASQAVEILRSSNVPKIPAQLLREGEVRLIDLRIARISSDARNLLLQSAVDPKFIGKYRLYWLIILSGENIRNGNLTYPVGSFLIDAETGEVVAATYYTTLPSMKWQTVFARLNYSSAKNLDVKNITITTCPKFTYEFPPPEDSLIKPVIRASCFPLVIENVVVVKPGASGKISLQIKPINIDSDIILSFEVVDPFREQDIPKDLISAPSEIVAKNGSTVRVPITVKAPQNARQKTYLIELDTYWRMPDWNHAPKTRTFFLLSVWDQRGEWPRPPSRLLTGLYPG